MTPIPVSPHAHPVGHRRSRQLLDRAGHLEEIDVTRLLDRVLRASGALTLLVGLPAVHRSVTAVGTGFGWS